MGSSCVLVKEYQCMGINKLTCSTTKLLLSDIEHNSRCKYSNDPSVFQVNYIIQQNSQFRI